MLTLPNLFWVLWLGDFLMKHKNKDNLCFKKDTIFYQSNSPSESILSADQLVKNIGSDTLVDELLQV